MTPALAKPPAGKAPVRMAFVYVPNGMDMRHWNMDYEGKLGVLPQTLRRSSRTRTTSSCSATSPITPDARCSTAPAITAAAAGRISPASR